MSVSVPPGTRVAIVTLGCGRNEVDSDQLGGLLQREGVTLVDDAADAEVVLVNTCTFIAPAKEESIDTVLAACDLKEDGAQAVVVVGCMAQRYPDELAESIPEADAIVGFAGYAKLPQLLGDILAGRPVDRITVDRDPTPPRRGRSLPVMAAPASDTAALPMTDEERPPEIVPDTAPGVGRQTAQDDLDRIPQTGPRFPVRRFDGRPWAYLKIASGCDRVCTFCAIPSFRGRFRSRPEDEILAEARWLTAQGARELVLVSENTTSWGKDLGGRHLQPKLLAALSEIDELERIRLMYLQPAELQTDLLEAMAELPKVAGYYDLSLQHASAPVLTRMARSGSPERFGQLIERIRGLDPDAVFRSNFILGFPGETEDDVAALEGFLDQARLDWVGLFTFSPEDGTPSATFDEQVPEDVAVERMRHLADVQERIADEQTRRFVGRDLDVTVQEHLDLGDGTVACIARSYREAPETDGEIRLVARDGSPVDLPVGRTLIAHVIEAEGVDLVAEVGGPTDRPADRPHG